MIKICHSCSQEFDGRRDARTCSARCRKRLQRTVQTLISGAEKINDEIKRVEVRAENSAHLLLDNQGGFASIASPSASLAPSNAAHSVKPEETPVTSKPLEVVQAPKVEDSSWSANLVPEELTSEVSEVKSETTKLSPKSQVVDTVAVPKPAPREFSKNFNSLKADTSLETFPYNPISREIDLTTPEVPTDKTPRRLNLPLKRVTISALASILLLTLATFGLERVDFLNNNKPSTYQTTEVISLGNGSGGQANEKLTVKGPLEIADSLIIVPSERPDTEVAAQVYFDVDTRQIFYYDGNEYLAVATDNSVQDQISQIDQSGLPAAGAGLQLTGNTLTNTGVLSLQGQSGDLALTEGDGIEVNGLEISNNGVLSVEGARGNINLVEGTGVDISRSGNDITISAVTTTTCTSCAHVSLSNLSAVAINTNLLPATTNNVDLGSSAERFKDLYLSGNATIAGALGVSGTISGNGSGLSALNASNISTGTLANARLNSSVSLLGQTIESSEVTDGTITNADINASAGIVDTKLATISTAGKVADSALSSNVTLQGNSFNGASQLVQLNASTQLPAVSGALLTNLNASNVASGTLADARLSSNVTLQGNTFNGASQLVQLTAGGILPVLDGSNLTALNASNLSSGTVVSGRISGSYTGITGVGALTAGSIGGSFGNINIGSNVFTGVGSGLTSLNASNISSGTLADARLSSNVALLNAGTAGSPQIFTGNNVFRTATDSVNGFRVQDNASSTVFNVDTLNGRVGIGDAAPDYKLEVTGDINITSGSAYRINGVAVCTSSGCSASSGSGNYIQNSTSQQTSADFNIDGSGTIGTQLILPLSGSSGGIEIGGDINIFRSAAEILKITGGELQVERDVAGDPAFTAYHTGSFPSWKVLADGKMNWGDGTVNNGDTNLYRDAAGTLKTDGKLVVGGDVQATGWINSNDFFSVAPGSDQIIFYAKVIGDTTDRYTVSSSGVVEWGSGAAARDTNLYRDSANQLKTDDALDVVGALTQNGSQVCLVSGNCAGLGGNGDILQNGNSFGVAMTIGTNDNFDLNLETNGATTATLTTAGQFQLPTQGSAGGLLLGGDTNLYRAAADTLKTDDSFTAAGYVRTEDVFQSIRANGGNGLTIQQTSDANARVALRADSKLEFGDGTNAADTNLYRSAADILMTDDALTVAGAATLQSTLGVTGNSTFTGLGTFNGGLTIEAGDTFTFNSDAFTDLTGTGLTISSGSLQTTLGTSVDLTSEVNGVLPIANGGTNANTAQGAINNISGLTTNGDLLYYDGTNSTRLARGAGGECLISNGTTLTWNSCAGSGTTFFTIQGTSGTPQSINGGDTVTIAAGTNITTTAGATDTITVATVNNPTFSTSVTTPSVTSSGALSLTSATTNSVTVDSGTTGDINIGTGNNSKSIRIGTGTAGNTINIGTDNTTADTIQIGSALDTLTLTGNSSSTFVINGTTISAAEFSLLDGHNTALVDIDDAVNTAITGTGALTSGSIASGFGTIATANTITGTTINGTTGINTGAGAGTQRIDSSGNLVNIGTITSGLINGQTISSSANFTGSVTIQGTGKTALSFSDTTTTTGITIGSDTNIYRDSANVLKTDDTLVVAGNLAVGQTSAGVPVDVTGSIRSNSAEFTSSFILQSTTVGSTLSPNLRFSDQSGDDVYLRKDGDSLRVISNAGDDVVSFDSSLEGIEYGSSGDTNLYRSAADTLRTDDAFVVGTLGSGGTVALCSNSGQISTCTGAGANTLQGSYDGGNTLTTTDARNIDITLANTTTDSNFTIDIATSSTSEFQVESNGTDVLQIGSAGQLQLDVQGSAGGILLGTDTNLYRSAANTLMTDDAFTTAGLLTGQAGATISGATASINASSNFATNINTGTSTGAVSIGNASAGAIAAQSASTIALTAGTTFSFSGTNATLNTTGQLQLPTQGGTGGILLGGDSALYRSAADYLRTTSTFDILQTSSSAFAVREATGGVASFLVNTTSNAVAVNNGADLTGYSGDFGAQTFNIDASNGSAQLGSSTTTSGVLNIGTNTTTAAGGIYLGSDTNLYRSAAGALASSSTGDVVLELLADSDNTNEDDNPLVRLSQDGGTTIGLLGMAGVAGSIFTDSASNSLLLGTESANSLQLATSDTVRLTIDSSGNVGIGDTTPDAKLDVSSTFSPGSFNVNSYAQAYGTGSSASYSGTYGQYVLTDVDITGAGFVEGYGIHSMARGADDAQEQNLYGVMAKTRTHASDVGYALFAGDEDDSTGGTMYGLYIDLDDTDVTRYGVYQNTINNNYFAGNIGIGDSTPGAKLEVDMDTDELGLLIDASAGQTEDLISGLVNGTDVFHVSAAGQLFAADSVHTNGNVNSTRASTGNNAFTAKVTGDTFPRLQINADGDILWGDGTATQDTNLYRSAANTLRTDDDFMIRSATNSTTAFQVQNASSTRAFSVDTTTGRVTVGDDTTPAAKLEVDLSSDEVALLLDADVGQTQDLIQADVNGVNMFRVQSDGDLIADGQIEGSDFYARGSSTSSTLLNFAVSGDTTCRLCVNANGGLNWGDGATLDTELYRSVSNRLYTPDELYVGSNFQVQGTGKTALTLNDTTTTTGITIGADTNIYRDSANTLKTDDAFIAGTLGAAADNLLCYDANNKLSSCSSSAGSANFIVNSTSGQTGNYNIQSAAAGSVGGVIKGAASQTADLLQFQNSGSTVLSKVDANGNLQGNSVATATTGTTSGTGTNTTTLTLSAAGSFANNDIIFIDNAGQDYYTRIVSGGGTTTLTVDPAVTFETGRTVTKYTAQNIGASLTDYTSNSLRFFEGKFLGQVTVGSGTTKLSDGQLQFQGDTNLYRSAANTLKTDDMLEVAGSGDGTAFGALFKNASNSTSAFGIQNSAGTTIFHADTSNAIIRPGVAAVATTTSRTTSTVSLADSSGLYNSMAIGADGLPIFSHYNITDTDLIITKCGNAACSSGNTTTEIADTDSVGQFTSIAIGKDGLPIVSYYNATDTDLKILKCGNAACSSGNTVTEITDTDSVGQYTSIAIGKDGLPVVSYFNLTDTDLKILKCGNAACSSGNTATEITNASTTGWFTSIAIGTDGLPIVSHKDNSLNDVLILKCGNAACSSGNTTTQISDAEQVGSDTSIAIGTDGLAVVSYYNNDDFELKILKCGNAACSSGNTVTEITDADTVGTESDISIGTDGRPIVVYENSSDQDLKVLKCGNAACSSGNTATEFSTVPDDGDYPAIAIGPDGMPVVVYRNTGAGADPNVLKCVNASCSSSSGGVTGSGVTLGTVSSAWQSVYFDTLNFGKEDARVQLNDEGNFSANGLFADNSGNVGIGNNSPANLLNIGALTTADSNAVVAISTGGTTKHGLIIQAVASQSANIFEIQSSAGSILASISATGVLTVSSNATIGGTLNVSGTLTVQGQADFGNHIRISDATPSATVNGSIPGVGATCNVSGTDVSGTITIVTGTGVPAAGVQCTITANDSFSTGRVVVSYESASGVSPNTPVISGTMASSTTFTLSAFTGFTASRTYEFNYIVIDAP